MDIVVICIDLLRVRWPWTAATSATTAMATTTTTAGKGWCWRKAPSTGWRRDDPSSGHRKHEGWQLNGEAQHFCCRHSSPCRHYCRGFTIVPTPSTPHLIIDALCRNTTGFSIGSWTVLTRTCWSWNCILGAWWCDVDYPILFTSVSRSVCFIILWFSLAKKKKPSSSSTVKVAN